MQENECWNEFHELNGKTYVIDIVNDRNFESYSEITDNDSEMSYRAMVPINPFDVYAVCWEETERNGQSDGLETFDATELEFDPGRKEFVQKRTGNRFRFADIRILSYWDEGIGVDELYDKDFCNEADKGMLEQVMQQAREIFLKS